MIHLPSKRVVHDDLVQVVEIAFRISRGIRPRHKTCCKGSGEVPSATKLLQGFAARDSAACTPMSVEWSCQQTAESNEEWCQKMTKSHTRHAREQLEWDAVFLQETMIAITAIFYACCHGQQDITDVMSNTAHAVCVTSMQDPV